jgi:hypothetical protein
MLFPRTRRIVPALLFTAVSASAAAQTPNFLFFPVGPTSGNAVDFFPSSGTATRCDWNFGDPATRRSRV